MRLNRGCSTFKNLDYFASLGEGEAPGVIACARGLLPQQARHTGADFGVALDLPVVLWGGRG